VGRDFSRRDDGIHSTLGELLVSESKNSKRSFVWVVFAGRDGTDHGQQGCRRSQLHAGGVDFVKKKKKKKKSLGDLVTRKFLVSKEGVSLFRGSSNVDRKWNRPVLPEHQMSNVKRTVVCASDQNSQRGDKKERNKQTGCLGGVDQQGEDVLSSCYQSTR